MLTTLIIISFVLWIATLVLNGLGLYILFPLIGTVMFAVRKFGIFIKFNNIILCEALPMFIATVFDLLFKRFDTVTFLVTLALRCVFIAIVVYDSKAYVYFTEERKTEE